MTPCDSSRGGEGLRTKTLRTCISTSKCTTERACVILETSMSMLTQTTERMYISRLK